MKSNVNNTPLQFEHLNGSLYMTLTQVTNKGFEIHESTFRLVVPHHEVPDVVERMLTTPGTNIDETRNSDEIQKLAQSSMSAPEMVEQAYNLIVAANLKTRVNRSLKEKDRLIKIAKAFNGMSDSEWEALDSISKEAYIANALRAEQVMAE